MLQSKYTFDLPYAELSILCAHLKAVQQRAVITPHDRKEGKSLELLLCSVILPMARRLDAKLFEWKATVRFVVKKEEALAFHCAYKYQWLPYHEASQQIFDTIDRVI